jgi:hypothetical protein
MFKVRARMSITEAHPRRTDVLTKMFYSVGEFPLVEESVFS